MATPITIPIYTEYERYGFEQLREYDEYLIDLYDELLTENYRCLQLLATRPTDETLPGTLDQLPGLRDPNDTTT